MGSPLQHRPLPPRSLHISLQHQQLIHCHCNPFVILVLSFLGRPRAPSFAARIVLLRIPAQGRRKCHAWFEIDLKLIADLKKENARAQEVNKKLDTLVQVASANFKRDKSKEKKPTSDKPAYRSSSKDKYSGSTKDVVMTDLSQQPQVSYGDNKLRADQSDEERIRKAKQQLRDEYNKYRQNSSMKQNNNNNRGRAATPGPKPQSRSGSNSSQKSGNGYSRSNSANGEKEAGATRVSVEVNISIY